MKAGKAFVGYWYAARDWPYPLKRFNCLTVLAGGHEGGDVRPHFGPVVALGYLETVSFWPGWANLVEHTDNNSPGQANGDFIEFQKRNSKFDQCVTSYNIPTEGIRVYFSPRRMIQNGTKKPPKAPPYHQPPEGTSYIMITNMSRRRQSDRSCGENHIILC